MNNRKNFLKIAQFTLVGLFVLVTSPVYGVGKFVPLKNQIPVINPGQMNLLSDGTVICFDASTDGPFPNCYKLTPDSKGSYANGTWKAIAPMHYAREYFAADLLPSGKLFVAGGEYGANGGMNTHGGSLAEIYDPLANTWTLASHAAVNYATNNSFFFADAPSETLPNGNILIGPSYPDPNRSVLIYNTAQNTWTVGGTPFVGTFEETWLKLPDASILTIDSTDFTSERYIPATNKWIHDGAVPVAMFDASNTEIVPETGPAALLPSGKAFFIGGTGNTALYTPTGTTAPGTWKAGPKFPSGLGVDDGPCAMLSNGKVLCCVGPLKPMYGGPAQFFEYDPVANTLTKTSVPSSFTDPSNGSFIYDMLDLPDGTVLCSNSEGTQLYDYQPDGTQVASGQPVVKGLSKNSDGSYLLIGTQLNGISEGACYGDDAQMATNYPIVWLVDSAGKFHYARTFNWSSTGVQTGTKLVTTDLTLPAGLAAGNYSLYVSANGIKSNAVAVKFSSSGLVRVQ